MPHLPTHPPSCEHCAGTSGQGFRLPFTMAFQPIFDIATCTVFAYEALVRPIDGGSAWDVLSQVTSDNRYSFDQLCRKRAIGLAAKLGMTANLSINFMPNAVYDPDHCIRATLWAAERYNFPIQQIIFEFIESEQIGDVPHLQNIVRSYQNRGFRTAIDDLGAGYTGLGMLIESEADIVKLDMGLIRGIDTDCRRQAIVKHLISLADALGMTCIIEGVETLAELQTVLAFGGRYIQGYLLSRPLLEELDTTENIIARLEAAGHLFTPQATRLSA